VEARLEAGATTRLSARRWPRAAAEAQKQEAEREKLPPTD